MRKSELKLWLKPIKNELQGLGFADMVADVGSWAESAEEQRDKYSEGSDSWEEWDKILGHLSDIQDALDSMEEGLGSAIDNIDSLFDAQ